MRHRIARAWLITGLALASGCGDDAVTPSDAPPDDAPSDDPFEERSGTRLVRQGHVIDGTEAFSSIFDTERSESCFPHLWTDGALRCTPSARRGILVYSDAACTQPAALASACSDEPVYLVESRSDGCSGGIERVRATGAELTATSFYNATSAGCQEQALEATGALYALAAEVPASAFATVTLSAPVGERRVRQPFFESADGLRWASQDLHDELIDATCASVGGDVGSGQCHPRDAIGASYYADDTCSERVAIRQGTCGTPRYATHPQTRCPNPTYELYPLGATRTLTTVYGVDGAATCSPVDLDDDDTAYDLGAMIPMASFTASFRPTDARIQRIYATSEGDALPTRFVYDAEKQTECRVRLAEDGVARCLPTAFPAMPHFRDAACSQPIDVVLGYRGPATCAPLPAPRFSVNGVTTCAGSTRVRAIVGGYTGPLYRFNGACVPIPTDGITTYYEVGAVVPPSEFSAATPTP